MRTAPCAALPFLLGACLGPDRWNMGVSRGQGELDGPYAHDYDSEDTRLEVGVSGPLWSQPERRAPVVPCEPIQKTAAPVAPPVESGGLPIEEILLILGGALGGEASRRGYNKVQSRRVKSG